MLELLIYQMRPSTKGSIGELSLGQGETDADAEAEAALNVNSTFKELMKGEGMCCVPGSLLRHCLKLPVNGESKRQNNV